MKLFDVYSLFDVEPVKAKGCYVYSGDGKEYLDFYGGHAVISIGHSHPRYIQNMQEQLEKIIFYSNSVQNSLQSRLAHKLGVLSDCENYDLYMCNSGAEAVETALKLASFKNGRHKVLAIKNSFHGRTSAAVNVTDNDKYKAPINTRFETIFLEMNDCESLIQHLNTHSFTAVIVEPIQGLGGLDAATSEFLQCIEASCRNTNTLFIADEIQSGFGRTGKFFAFQHCDVVPDIITVAKGMGNGFPVGGVLIRNGAIEAWTGMLGATFGGNHFSCQACLSVLEVLESENLIANAERVGELIREKLSDLPGVRKVKGKGLMLGAEFNFPVSELRKNLVYEQQLFTGSSSNPNLLRLLPPLMITEKEVEKFFRKLEAGIQQLQQPASA